jgi:predicted HAD superfamily Cof-like phosphohydrolase
MDKSQRQVQEFHKAFDYPMSPAIPALRFPELRANLIAEEAIETIIALVGSGRAQTVVLEQLIKALEAAVQKRETAPSLERAIDGLCDLKYVTDGTAEVIGIDLEPFSDEVHRSNMSKVGGVKREDGKLVKPKTYSPANIAGVLEQWVGRLP